jgi:hypothetical protein
MDLSIDLFITLDEFCSVLAFGVEQGARLAHDRFSDGVWQSEELPAGEHFAQDVARIIGSSPCPGTTRFYFLMDPAAPNPRVALDWFKIFVVYGGADEAALYKSSLTTRTGHEATGTLARKAQRRLAKMTQPGVISSGTSCTRGAARLSGSGILLRDRSPNEIISNDGLQLRDLPQNVRNLVDTVVCTLAERGPRGLVEDGLCAPDAEDSMTETRGDYAGRLIELPDFAELWVTVNRDGNLDIEIPLYDDREGRMDLHIFLEIDPNIPSVKVTGLYTP